MRSVRVPPECRRIRRLLFDYCGHELEAGERERVDEHVVRCKECGTMLSQVELDELRLREALVPMEPPVDFTLTVMDRVRGVIAEADPQAPSRGFTKKVMDRVCEEAGAARTDHRERWRNRVVTAVAAVLLVALTLALRQLMTSPVESPVKPAWSVVDTRGQTGLEAGQEIAAPGRLAWESGSALLEASGMGGGSRWDLRLTGATAAAPLARGVLRLDAGELWLDTTRRQEAAAAFQVRFPDGQILELAAGTFRISVQPVALDEDPLAPVAGLVRLIVRVHDGQARFLVADRNGPIRLDRGWMATVEPLRPVAVRSFRPAGSVERQPPITQRDAGTVDPPAGALVVRGRILDPEWRGVADATVTLHLGDASPSVRSMPDGAYELRSAWPKDAAGEPYLSVEPPAGELDAVRYRPFKRPLAPDETLEEEIQLARLRPVTGRVFDHAGNAVAGALVRPLRIDSYTQSARFLHDVRDETDAEGRFRLKGWAQERRGETTVLVVEPTREPPHATYALSRAGRTELLVRLPRSVRVELPVKGAKTRVVWVEQKPAGPASLYLRKLARRELSANASVFHARVPTPGVVRWWEDAGSNEMRVGYAADIAASGASGGVVLPGEPRQLAGPVPKPDQEDFAPAPGFLLASAGRFAPRPRSAPTDPGSEERGRLTLRLRALGSPAPVAHAEVFVRVGTGPAWFGGWSDLDGRLELGPLPLGVPIRALALEPRPFKRVGTLRFSLSEGGGERTLAMAPSGAVEGRLLSAASDGDRLVELEVVTGQFQGYLTTAVVDEEGNIRAGDVPPGRIRAKRGGRRTETGGGIGNKRLPPWRLWESDR